MNCTDDARIFRWLSLGILILSRTVLAAESKYSSPFDVAYSSDGQTLAISDRTGRATVLLNTKSNELLLKVALKGEATGIAWGANSSRFFVAERDNNSVAEIDAAKGKVLRRFATGYSPAGLLLLESRDILLVCNSAEFTLSVIDLKSGKEAGRVAALRNPYFAAASRDQSVAVVGNLLPEGAATDANHASALTVLDVQEMKVHTHVRLPAGSSAVRGVAISPDSKWAYCVHTLGRTNLPTTQLDRGWVNTNALSVIDLESKQHYATVLLDRIFEGAADPWGLALSQDGKTAWLSLAGIHQVARLDLTRLHKLMAGGASDKDPQIWQEVKKAPSQRALLVNDLSALYAAGLIERIPIPANGPRGISLSPDGKTIAVASYFSGSVVQLDTSSLSVSSQYEFPGNTPADPVRRGEMLFHDALTTYQHWLSCATCHPADQRMDGMNWDNLNDGIGNPKNTKSLVNSHLTPPTTWQAVRENMDVSVAMGFKHIKFREPIDEEVDAVRAYLRSLKPEKSPHLNKDGKLTDAAKRGRALFSSQNCAHCHKGEQFTDQKLHDVGTRRPFDNTSSFDTPSLVEAWRTGPYLHDGAAASIKDIFKKFNPRDEHGSTSDLSDDELNSLVEYILSL